MIPNLPELQVTPFIAGRFARESAGAGTPVVSPWTGEIIAHVAPAAPEQADQAADAARMAFDEGEWPEMPPFDRGRILQKIADGILARLGDLSLVESLNAGKPLRDARREVEGAARVFTYFAGAMDKFYGDTIPASASILTFTLREPLGVVGQITPWNFPLLAASWKLAPALAAGCTCILKPSPLTPLSTLLLATIIRDSGVPGGVVNILPGGAATGAQICEDERVDGISFTGSTGTGSAIMRAAAGTIKKIALELGGKNANVIFGDAHIEKAAASAVRAAFGNAGQSCSARSRLLVERGILAAFTEAFVSEASKLRFGAFDDPAASLGPLISRDHWMRVSASVAAAKAAGARLLTGEKRPSSLPDGFFYPATIFADVTPDMAIFHDEIFGPVCSITAFDTEDEAVQLANTSAYGLNGSVWCRDIGRALRVARKIRTGMIAINGLPSASTTSVLSPFGGYKRSGIGRELGMQALEFYTELKNISIDQG
jgi:acyl-CoA reductase-like NAD-dependent aldehyde dehydrogenase